MGVLTILGGVVGVVFLLAFNSIFSGYALSVLWGWFIVPTFGAPRLAVIQAIGVVLVVSYLTHQTPDQDKKEGLGEVILRGAIGTVMRPAVALFVGWTVHLFM